MKIALCDDDERDLALLTGYCRRYDADILCGTFLRAADLLDAFDREFYDLVFLDIEMPQPNGWEAGKLLAAREPAPLIVFTTQTLGYAVRGYGVALRYLPKPIDYGTFAAVMRLAADKILPEKLTIRENGASSVLSIHDILYFEAFAHDVVFYTRDGRTLKTTGKFAEFAQRLSPGRFAQPHRSYCVNLDHIDRIAGGEITMINGDVVPLSKKRRDDFQKRLSDHIKGTYAV